MISIPINKPENNNLELREAAKNLVKDKSLEDALFSIAVTKGIIPNIEELKSTLENEKKEETLSDLLPIALVDHEGKPKSIRGGDQESLEDQMIRLASSYHNVCGQDFLRPAFEQICLEHSANPENLSFVVYNNPFIPPGHEELYKQGLSLGIQGNLVIAAHLLIPQLENSLRYLLKQKGHISSNLSSKRIQNDYMLGKVCESLSSNEVLPEKVILTLKSLLADENHMGANLRNEICHGLFTYEQFYQGQVAYLVGLTLHLCLQPFLKQWLNKQSLKD